MLTVRPIALAFSLLFAFECCTAASPSVRAVSNETGIALSIEVDGSFEVTSRIPAWQFSGKVGAPISNLAPIRGKDLAGDYQEIEFKYRPSESAIRLGAIRVYDHRPIIVFSLRFLTRGGARDSFPSIASYPRNLHHLTYTSTFGGFSFKQFGTDGPWVFFDDQANTFIFLTCFPLHKCCFVIRPESRAGQRSIGERRGNSGRLHGDDCACDRARHQSRIRDLGKLSHRSCRQETPS